MGQEPTFEIRAEDRPRAELGPAPARRWSASRPGDLHAPSEVPWGGGFGTPGPDTGYAHKLAAAADVSIGDDENRHNVDAMLVLIMGARASLFGKGPSADDLDYALVLAGLGTREAIPESIIGRLAERRRYWAPRVAHSKSQARLFVGGLSAETLRFSVEDLRHRLALGEVSLAP
jgi:hypothetical protein